MWSFFLSEWSPWQWGLLFRIGLALVLLVIIYIGNRWKWPPWS